MSRPFQHIIPAEIDWIQGIPYAKQFDDIYYSRENGLAESEHVFISGNDLLIRWQQLQPNDSFAIAETGFGTGLNFLLTMRLWKKEAPKNASLYYYACEKHPLKLTDLCHALSVWPELEVDAKQLIEKYPTLTPGFHCLEFGNGIYLNLIFADAESSLSQLLPSCEGMIDSWYLDGFSPAKNQSMWTSRLFDLIGTLSHEKTKLSTFSCARQVKDSLLQAGFSFEKVRGYGQKREMIKAVMSNPDSKKKTLKKQSVWQFGHYHSPEQKHALVIGAGLAGCMIAYHLARRGWQITIVDQAARPGIGASANPRAVLFPSFSAYESPLSQLMLQAYPHAVRFYQQIDLGGVEHEFNGMVSLAESEVFGAIVNQWLEQLSPMVHLLSGKLLSEKTGLTVTQDGLWFPQSGWINSQQLCCQLIKRANIHFIGGVTVTEMERIQNKWQLGDFCADVVVLANGWQMKQYQQTQFLPLRAIKGQMTAIKATPQSEVLKIPICGNGHVLPASNKGRYHYAGATYQIDQVEPELSDEDDLNNLKSLNKLPIICDWSNEVIEHWSGIRTTTNDYLPVVGAIPNKEQFIHNFKSLEKDANRSIDNLDPFEPNLYAFTGFGSRGLTTIPLCASYLAAFISHQPTNIPNSLISALAPARFLHRSIIRRTNGL